MRWSTIKDAGVDFTFFRCIDGLFSMIGGVVAGFIAQQLGYTALYEAILLASGTPLPGRHDEYGIGSAPFSRLHARHDGTGASLE
ncbi:hypothetical protein ACMHYO_22335 [Allopusillimonas ginsengisoli]|uniref:hypothetical protein n=1 Tax=Allopusillimonas ginsengisoli TaxID=453575 RepID=UPI0010C19514|nr:hypothetical protein D7I39_13090 [Allopusillimonas ginsengisoli]